MLATAATRLCAMSRRCAMRQAVADAPWRGGSSTRQQGCGLGVHDARRPRSTRRSSLSAPASIDSTGLADGAQPADRQVHRRLVYRRINQSSRPFDRRRLHCHAFMTSRQAAARASSSSPAVRVEFSKEHVICVSPSAHHCVVMRLAFKSRM